VKDFQTLSKNEIKQLAKLKQGKYRHAAGQYIISGLRSAGGALQALGFKPASIMVQQGREHLLHELNLSSNSPVYMLSEADFRKISGENSPQGIALLADCPVHQPDKTPQDPVLIYLQNINDPGNLGNIIRGMLWFGFNELLLSPESVDPYSPKSVRASAGFISHCRIFQDIKTDELIELKERSGYRLYGTSADSGTEISSFRPAKDERFILIFGSEARGLSEELSIVCDEMLTIRRTGAGESLNLGTSAALFLYQIRTALDS